MPHTGSRLRSIPRQMIGLKDARQYERYAVRINLLVHSHGRFQSVTALNLSQGGMLLDGTFGLTEGGQICIELLNGRVIEAVVMWSVGRQTGIAFKRPLASDDELLIAK